MSDRVRKIALYGTPGAGKSTTSELIRARCSELDIGFTRLKLADPLYLAQSKIYEIAGRDLEDFYTQDGELLGFLGVHLRKINPDVLLNSFDRRVEQAMEAFEQSSSVDGCALLLCDDMRYPDWGFLEGLGFMPVRIVAEEPTCLRRRQERGDLTLTSASALIEQGLDKIPAAATVENDGTLDELNDRVRRLVEELI
jgi:cytidine deaminase